MLCTLLLQTLIAGRPTEYFGPSIYEELRANRNLVQAHDVRDYFKRAIARSTTENGCFGMKLTAPQTVLFIRHASDYRGRPYGSLREALETEFPGLRYIFLTRTNKIAQAISFYRALRDQVWQLRAGDPRSAMAIAYDHYGIQRCYQEAVADDAYWEGFFAMHAIKPLRITYEDLTNDYVREMHRVGAHLGFPADTPIAPPLTMKIAGEVSAKWEVEFLRTGQVPEPMIMRPEWIGAPY